MEADHTQNVNVINEPLRNGWMCFVQFRLLENRENLDFSPSLGIKEQVAIFGWNLRAGHVAC